jgi:DUF1680 family protein
MLICFAGMVELYRATGEEKYLTPVLIGCEDIVAHHLYITGSASTGEHFQANYALRNDGYLKLGETCVSMTWLYLNLSLGRLTGESRFWDMAEQTLYNHLLAAQSEDGRGWAYYLGLRDSKRYRWHTDPDCCPSRGARALAQMPTHLFSLTDDGVAVNFYEPASAELEAPEIGTIRLEQRGRYPFDGAMELRVGLASPSRFGLRFRIPGWCASWQVSVNGQSEESERDSSGYISLTREWRDGDTVRLAFDMPARVLADAQGNNGKVAFARGPLVFAADFADLSAGPLLDDVVVALASGEPASAVAVAATDDGVVQLSVPLASLQPPLGRGFWREPERYHEVTGPAAVAVGGSVRLVPFFLAGNRQDGSYRHDIVSNVEPVTDVTFQVWLPYVFTE